MASVPISSAYLKQLERTSISETITQSNGIEVAEYENIQNYPQGRRPSHDYIFNVQTMFKSALQSLTFFASAPSEQRFKDCVDRH